MKLTAHFAPFLPANFMINPLRHATNASGRPAPRPPPALAPLPPAPSAVIKEFVFSGGAESDAKSLIIGAR